MDPLIGAAIAVGVAWLSIFVIILLPWRPPVKGLRRGGAMALAAVALMLWGVPLPPWAPLAVLVIGVGISSLRARRAGRQKLGLDVHVGGADEAQAQTGRVVQGLGQALAITPHALPRAQDPFRIDPPVQEVVGDVHLHAAVGRIQVDRAEVGEAFSDLLLDAAIDGLARPQVDQQRHGAGRQVVAQQQEMHRLTR